MGISTPLINAAHKLIDSFGCNATLYPIASASTATNDEGDLTVSVWAGTTTIKVVDGGNQGVDLVQDQMGVEQVGSDEKIIRDDVTVAVRDRLTYDGSNYRIVGLRAVRVESTDIIQIIKVAEATDTTNWH